MNTEQSGPVGSGSSEGLGGRHGMRAVVEFLDGSAPLEGVWYSDLHPTERGHFWWRKHLHTAADELTEALLSLTEDAQLVRDKLMAPEALALRIDEARAALAKALPLNAKLTGEAGGDL